MVIPWESVTRLLVAFVLGGLVGIEREVHRKPAGLRTHILISLASALFTILSLSFTGSPDSRIASNILVGMGFVGGGVIISSGGQVRGVTTAASLWVAAAIGMAAGLGEFTLATISTIFVLFTLWFLQFFEKFEK